MTAARTDTERRIAFEAMERVLMHDDRQADAGIPIEARVINYDRIYEKAKARVLRREATHV